MSAHKLLPVALLLSLSAISTAHAASCEKQSATTRIPLVELYTSEGCSSCPVADRWLSELAPEIVSADEMVALAFHVDYWDRLGWKDRFASPAYTERQKTNSKVNGSAFVFTPQIVLAGRNYEKWQDSRRVQQDVRKVLAVAPDATLFPYTTLFRSHCTLVSLAAIKRPSYISTRENNMSAHKLLPVALLLS